MSRYKTRKGTPEPRKQGRGTPYLEGYPELQADDGFHHSPGDSLSQIRRPGSAILGGELSLPHVWDDADDDDFDDDDDFL